MADVSTEQIKELRNQTQVSVMECKKALQEAEGDMEDALDILAEKSERAAAKKAGRNLGAGVVASYIHNDNSVGAMVELMSETDFVARNEEFQELAYEIAMHVAAMQPQYVSRDDVPEEVFAEVRDEFMEEFSDKPEDVREDIVAGKLNKHFKNLVLLEQDYIKDDEKTIEDLLNEATQTFGENVSIGQISRIATLS